MLQIFAPSIQIGWRSTDHGPKRLGATGRSCKLRQQTVHMACCKNFFAVRVVNPWNLLPRSGISAPTPASLKARLDRVWSHHIYVDLSEWFQIPSYTRTSYHPVQCEKNVQKDCFNNWMNQTAQRRLM